MIPLSLPHLNGNEWQYVKDCLDTGWISSAGNYVSLFESAVARQAQSPYGAACINGTAGLHLSLICAGVEQGDHVIVPNLTFVASLNAISHAGASPIMIDINLGDWQMDSGLLKQFLDENTESKEEGSLYFKKTGRKIKAIMPVHVLGNMGDMDQLQKLACKYHLDIIEDSTEALGSTYRGKQAGSFGKFGVFSFNGNKIISTGGGGVVVSQDKALIQKITHLSSQAKISADIYDHDEVGYNYRMVNILAAVGLAQMEQFPQHLEKKKAIDRYYREELAGIGDIRFQTVSEEVDPNCWLFTFRTKYCRDLITFLNENEIQCRPFWKPMNQLVMYKGFHYQQTENISDKVYQDGISIPSSVGLTSSQLEKVTKYIKLYYKNIRIKNINKSALEL